MDNMENVKEIDPLLEVAGLKTQFVTEDGCIRAVDGVDLVVYPGEVLGLVGESGCGKTVTSHSILRLVRPPGRIVAGSIEFEKSNLLDISENEMVQLRGDQISMIFQQPQTSLDPVYKVGSQISEVFRKHRKMDKNEAWRQSVELLRLVGIPDPEKKAHAYPFEMSGGQAQRVMIAMALALNPKLLIADEPTTALDVTIQAQILDLLRDLKNRLDTSVILITHDLGVIAEMANRVAVMYAGLVVEQAGVNDIFDQPLHPYTQGLIASIPSLGEKKDRLEVIPGNVPDLIDLPEGCRFWPRCQARIDYGLSICQEGQPLLQEAEPGHLVRCWLYQDEVGHKAPGKKAGELQISEKKDAGAQIRFGPVQDKKEATPATELIRIEKLAKYFPFRSGLFNRPSAWVQAVDDVDFSIYKTENLGLVGESGCGKTTVGRMILRLEEPTRGSIYYDGKDISSLRGDELKTIRRDMQIIFQDPYASLNPRLTVGESIGLGLNVHNIGNKKERFGSVLEIMKKVGLEEYHAQRYPHEFSGGQRQRIGIARALILRPRLIICDEPVSALDMSIQSQVLNLLKDLQGWFGLTYLFIAHNLSVVEHVSDRVAVMYLGKIVEMADTGELFANPIHPYTQALLSAIPIPKAHVAHTRTILRGDVPSPVNPPTGCRFHPRCPVAMKQCACEQPVFEEISPEHYVACWKSA
jgi:peptide/nickel transport system ATP-binding protein